MCVLVVCICMYAERISDVCVLCMCKHLCMCTAGVFTYSVFVLKLCLYFVNVLVRVCIWFGIRLCMFLYVSVYV